MVIARACSSLRTHRVLIAFQPALLVRWSISDCWRGRGPPFCSVKLCRHLRGGAPPHRRRPRPAVAGHVRTPCDALPTRSSRARDAPRHLAPATGVSGLATAPPGMTLRELCPSPRPLEARPTSYPFRDIPHTCGMARLGVQSGQPHISLPRPRTGVVHGIPRRWAPQDADARRAGPGRDQRAGPPASVSGRMSMRQPVSLAASRAFWPSLPMARLSW